MKSYKNKPIIDKKSMKGILFTAPLFHKVVSGEKTQTRRIVNPQPDDEGLYDHDKYPMLMRSDSDKTGFWGTDAESGKSKEFKPRYKVGETMYLKEPYSLYTNNGETRCMYKYMTGCTSEGDYVWKNKLFMPECYARYFIQITGVHCERLQDISHEDCMKEGIELCKSLSTRKKYALPDSPNYAEFYTPQQAYAALIDQINGKGRWKSDPFVWVYDFKLMVNN